MNDKELQRIAYLKATGQRITDAQEKALQMAYKNSSEFKDFYNRLVMAYGNNAKRSGGNGRARTIGNTNSGSTLPGLNRNLQARSSGYGNGHTISPGGFKKSGQDEDSDIRRSGSRTPDAVLNKIEFKTKKGRKKGEVVDDGVVFNGRRYSQRQVDWITSRALTGATLSSDQQAIYDRLVKREQDALADERKAKAAEESRQAREEAQRDRIELEHAKASGRIKERLAVMDRQAQLKERAEREKQSRIDQAAEAFNQKWNLPEGTRLGQRMRDLIQTGQIKYGYTPEDQKTYDALNAEMSNVLQDYELSDEDKAEAQKLYQERMNKLRKTFTKVPLGDRPLEAIRNEAKANGGYYKAANGEIKYLGDKEAELAAKRQQQEDNYNRNRQNQLADAQKREEANNNRAVMNAVRRDMADYRKRKEEFERDRMNEGKTYPEFDMDASISRNRELLSKVNGSYNPDNSNPTYNGYEEGASELFDEEPYDDPNIGIIEDVEDYNDESTLGVDDMDSGDYWEDNYGAVSRY